MLLIGLTGSIATGKSTVSALLTAPTPYHLPLIDADILARRAVDPGTSAYRQIVDYFGPSTPDLLLPGTDGNGTGRPLNRAALGRRVFGDSEENKRDRKVLNGIVHPAVRWEMYKSLLWYYVTGHWAVVLDIPLLFESGLDLLCAVVLVVGVRDGEVQVQRLLKRDSEMTREEAEGRVASQMPMREKVGRCEVRNQPLFSFLGGHADKGRGYVVWNDGDKEDLRHEVERVMARVRQRSPGWWSWVCLLVPPVGVVAGAWQMLRNWIDRRRWERRQQGGKSERAKL